MESADAEQIAEDVAMEDASVRTENDYIAHGRCQPRQAHARRAGTAASRFDGVPCRAERDKMCVR